MLKVSSEGLELIKNSEGLKLKAYRCPAGKLTIGYGHTGKDVKPEQKITKKEAGELLKADVADTERTINKLVKVPLKQNQFDTLVSFVYNIGAVEFKKSTLLDKLNNGNYTAVPAELMRWVYCKKKVLSGLVARRQTEADLWDKNTNKVAIEEIAKKDYTNTEGKGVAVTGVGAIGTACSETAIQLVPFVEVATIIKYIFIGILVTGALFTLYAKVRKGS